MAAVLLPSKIKRQKIMDTAIQSNKTSRKRISDLLFILWAGGAALLSYSLVYMLRKPYTAAAFEDLEVFNMDYKVAVTIVQILGYVVSKFMGIKLISELRREERLRFILMSVVFSFIEGRRMTDVLASLLGVSMVISSGTAKSVGLYVMDIWQVSEFWMPALIGAVALPLLALLGYALNRLPQPTEEDIALKSERETLNGRQRWELFKNFMPFLTMLFVANIAIVVLRDIKEDFLVNIIDMSGYSPWLFTQIDSVVTLTILAIFGLMVLVKDNFKALSVLYGLIITGMMVMAFVSFGQERMGLSPVTWLFLQSLCLYMAYLTFQTIFFDRFIACFKIRGNVGFFIVLTDFLGYTGTILVLVLKEFVGTRLDWAVFYNQLAGYVGIFCCATFVASFVYLRQRYRKETALCGCEEIATLEPTENNVLTIA